MTLPQPGVAGLGLEVVNLRTPATAYSPHGTGNATSRLGSTEVKLEPRRAARARLADHGSADLIDIAHLATGGCFAFPATP